MKRALATLTLLGLLSIPGFSVVAMAEDEPVFKRFYLSSEGRGMERGGRDWRCWIFPWWEFVGIGEGFAIRNVRVEPHPEGARIAGDILNMGRGFFGFAFFKIQLFDKERAYLGGNNLSISSFQRGTVRAFQVVVPRVQVQVVFSYSNEFIP